MKCPHCGKKINVGALIGARSTPKKAEAARRNGAKGGRPSKTITDGFGQTWAVKCTKCKRNTMEVVRPGKAQCSKCG